MSDKRPPIGHGPPSLVLVIGPEQKPGPSYIIARWSASRAALEAIAATLASSVGVEQNRAPNGDYFNWLDPHFVDRLRAMRGPGESYSDVILRLAGEDA